MRIAVSDIALSSAALVTRRGFVRHVMLPTISDRDAARPSGPKMARPRRRTRHNADHARPERLLPGPPRPRRPLRRTLLHRRDLDRDLLPADLPGATAQARELSVPALGRRGPGGGVPRLSALPAGSSTGTRDLARHGEYRVARFETDRRGGAGRCERRDPGGPARCRRAASAPAVPAPSGCRPRRRRPDAPAALRQGAPGRYGAADGGCGVCRRLRQSAPIQCCDPAELGPAAERAPPSEPGRPTPGRRRHHPVALSAALRLAGLPGVSRTAGDSRSRGGRRRVLSPDHRARRPARRGRAPAGGASGATRGDHPLSRGGSTRHHRGPAQAAVRPRRRYFGDRSASGIRSAAGAAGGGPAGLARAGRLGAVRNGGARDSGPTDQCRCRDRAGRPRRRLLRDAAPARGWRTAAARPLPGLPAAGGSHRRRSRYLAGAAVAGGDDRGPRRGPGARAGSAGADPAARRERGPALPAARNRRLDCALCGDAGAAGAGCLSGRRSGFAQGGGDGREHPDHDGTGGSRGVLAPVAGLCRDPSVVRSGGEQGRVGAWNCRSIASRARSARCCWWPTAPAWSRSISKPTKAGSTPCWRSATDITGWLGPASRLEAYFAGELGALDEIPVETGGTEFQRAVWTGLRQIPTGTVTSYGDLAASLGRPKACRAVGYANSLNPVAIVLPCHRVIGKNRTLTGYAGGLERKRWLLAHEGANQGASAE